MQSLRLAFAGTPEFSVPALQALVDAGHRVVGVWTQPDRAAGRGRRLRDSPVKARAIELGLPVHQPLRLRDAEAQSALAELEIDALVVVAYGLILPPAVLALPRLGCFNIHASLLPRWRGAAPIQRALLAGDAETGVTIMRMDASLDTGPTLLRETAAIEPLDTSQSLQDKLAPLGAHAIVKALDRVAGGNSVESPQSAEGANYAAKIQKSEAIIDWAQTAVSIDRQVRAFNPWPIAETTFDGERLRIWQARIGAPSIMAVPAAAGAATPGAVLAVSEAGIEVACGRNTLLLQKVQMPGRATVTAAELARSRKMAGKRLGSK